MKTYEVFGPSSNSNITTPVPSHKLKADSFAIGENNVAIFYDKDMNIIHALAMLPGLFIRSVEG